MGSGPFPSELLDETGERLRKEGNEFGSTTGRPRRCGWLDLVQLHYSCMINGVSDLCITKLDVLNSFEEIKWVDSYTLDTNQTTLEWPFDLQQIKMLIPLVYPVGCKILNIVKYPINCQNQLPTLSISLNQKPVSPYRICLPDREEMS